MLVYISGPDNFLATKAINQIKAKYLEKNPTGAEITLIDGNDPTSASLRGVNWADLQAVPLFATSRLVIIKSAGKFDKDKQENLAHFLRNIPDTTVVVLWDEKKIDPKTALFTSLQGAKKAISATPLSYTAIRQNTLKRAKELSLDLSTSHLEQILDSCGTDLWAIENELIYRSNSVGGEGEKTKKTILDEPFAVFNYIRQNRWDKVKNVIKTELEAGFAIEMILGGVAAAARKELRDATTKRAVTDLLMDIDVGLKTGILDDQAAGALLIAHLPKPIHSRVQWEDTWGEITF